MAKLNLTNEQKTQHYQKRINLIHSAVKQFKEEHEVTFISYDDLFQSAVIGFLKGLDQYDDSKNANLENYLITCMKSELKQQARSEDKSLNI